MHESAIAAFDTVKSLLRGIEDDPTFQPRFIFHVDASSPAALHAEVEQWVTTHSDVAAAVPQPLDVEYMAITQARHDAPLLRPLARPGSPLTTLTPPLVLSVVEFTLHYTNVPAVPWTTPMTTLAPE